jgi:MFS family permease
MGSPACSRRVVRSPGPSRLPRTVLLLGFTSLFTDIGTEMIFPLLPVFLVETLRAGPTYVGLIEGTADTVASLLKLASGIMADVVRRRKPLVLIGYGLAGAARPFVALATQPWHVLAVRVTDRVGKGIRGSPRDALIADAAGDRTGRAFGFHQSMDNVGAVVGPLLATFLIARHWAIRSVFWLAVVPGVVAVILVAIVREAPPTTTAKALSTTVSGPRAALDRPLRLYLGILFVFSMGNSSDAFLLLRARSLGTTTAAIPVLWSALNLSKVFWAYLGGVWADRIPRVRLVAAGWLVFAAVYLGLAIANAPWHVWALFIVYGIFYGLTEPVEKALVKDLAHPDARGRAYGAYNFVGGIAALPASLLTGIVWRARGPAVALEVGAGLAVLSLCLLLAWNVWRAPSGPHPRAG